MLKIKPVTREAIVFDQIWIENLHLTGTTIDKPQVLTATLTQYGLDTDGQPEKNFSPAGSASVRIMDLGALAASNRRVAATIAMLKAVLVAEAAERKLIELQPVTPGSPEAALQAAITAFTDAVVPA